MQYLLLVIINKTVDTYSKVHDCNTVNETSEKLNTYLIIPYYKMRTKYSCIE